MLNLNLRHTLQLGSILMATVVLLSCNSGSSATTPGTNGTLTVAISPNPIESGASATVTIQLTGLTTTSAINAYPIVSLMVESSAMASLSANSCELFVPAGKSSSNSCYIKTTATLPTLIAGKTAGTATLTATANSASLNITNQSTSQTFIVRAK